MKKSIYSFLWMMCLLLPFSSAAQQEKLAALVFTTSSNEALLTFNQALHLYDLGEIKQARGLFEKAVKQDPRFTAAYLYLAGMAVTLSEQTQLLSKAKSQLERSSQWEKLFYDYSETFVTGNTLKRVESAQKMIAMFPSDPRSFCLLGDALTEQKEIAAARKYYQQAMEIDPASPLGYRGIANSLLFNEPKEFKKAEHYAAKLVSLNPVSPAYILMGDAYRAQNSLQKAKASYGKAIDADPEDPVAYYKRGHAYTFLGEFDKARVDYGKARMLDKLPTTAIINTALTYLYEGQPANGLRHLILESENLDTKDVTQAMQVQFELLSTAAQIAFHIKDGKTLQQIVALIEPLAGELMIGMPVETQLNIKSEVLYWQAGMKIINKDLEGAASLLEGMKLMLDPVQDPRKLEEYEFLNGMISFDKKEYKAAIKHFEQADALSSYVKYWIAKAFEESGDADKAKRLYREIAAYLFNEVGFALIRNEVMQKR